MPCGVGFCGVVGLRGIWLFRAVVVVGWPFVGTCRELGAGFQPIGVGVSVANKPCNGEAMSVKAPNCNVICTTL